MLFAQYVSMGNGYAYIRRNDKGQPLEIIPVTQVQSWFAPERAGNPDQVLRWYHASLVTSSLRKNNIPSGNMLSVHGDGFDGISSPSPIRYVAASTLEMARAATQHNLGTLTRGLHSRLAIVGQAGSAESMAALVNQAERTAALLEKIEGRLCGSRELREDPCSPSSF